MVFPQTFTLNSNGWIYSIDDFFERFDLSDDAFDPVQARMRADKEEILSRSGYSGSEDISDLLLYASSVDAGSRVNAKNAAQRFGFGFVKSAKNRVDEGDSSITNSDDLGAHLLRLKEYTTDATIRVYSFDDKMNTGGTSNDEAKERKRQVTAFNAKHDTDYKVEVELVVTHLRFPELGHIKHEHLDRVTIFDTVPYLPPLEEQLNELGMGEKFHVLKNTPHQVALGIALDYFAQRIHRKLERNPPIIYKDVTDRFLVQKTPWGQDLKNMMRHYDEHP